jgi:hypothetical protein
VLWKDQSLSSVIDRELLTDWTDPVLLSHDDQGGCVYILKATPVVKVLLCLAI